MSISASVEVHQADRYVCWAKTEEVLSNDFNYNARMCLPAFLQGHSSGVDMTWKEGKTKWWWAVAHIVIRHIGAVRNCRPVDDGGAMMEDRLFKRQVMNFAWSEGGVSSCLILQSLGCRFVR
mmetsp:Transcript_22053/g.32840  ORF Transcript_22053/g.32840 Transcript_22053/m.32840 type:complete len:122 (-) Transcript_22053:368-733(-)